MGPRESKLELGTSRLVVGKEGFKVREPILIKVVVAAWFVMEGRETYEWILSNHVIDSSNTYL